MMRYDRREVLLGLSVSLLGAGVGAARPAARPAGDWVAQLIGAARLQVGTTVRYDPAYTKLAYPGGDVPREKGVCTDVLVRAYRDAFGVDLQALVHEDMKRAFSVYPKRWSLARPDPSIDHRRVLNLMVYFQRRGLEIGPKPLTAAAFVPGDIATQMLPGNLPHIGIVSDKMGAAGARLLIHNIGAGTEETDKLGLYQLTGRFRLPPPD